MGGIAKVVTDQTGGNSIGSMVEAAMKSMGPEAKVEGLQKQVTHLAKLVHILWKEAERLEKIVQITPDGLRIKSGRSEILVLKNGGIILDGHRIHLKTPGKDQLMF
jgi:hypothetical protein